MYIREAHIARVMFVAISRGGGLLEFRTQNFFRKFTCGVVG